MSMTVCSSLTSLPPGCFLCDCAVSGGTLDSFLHSARKEAEGLLCVRLAPVYMDFTLPCPGGVGKTLTAAELKALYPGTTCYFSKSLCTEYFTYAKDCQAHVVLFDSLRSLQEKYRRIRAAGIPYVLIEDPALRSKL